MTKQELYTALTGEFDIVTPVAEWKQIGEIKLGITRYDIDVFKYGKGFEVYVVYVEDDGGANENATFGGNDPTIPTPPSGYNFPEEVNNQLDSLVTDGTIVGYIPTLFGNDFAEIMVYRLVSSVLTKFDYLVWRNSDDTIGYQQIG